MSKRQSNRLETLGDELMDKIYNLEELSTKLMVMDKEIDITTELITSLTELKDLESIVRFTNHMINQIEDEDELIKVRGELRKLVRKDEELIIWSANVSNLMIYRLMLLAIINTNERLRRLTVAGIIWHMRVKFNEEKRLESITITEEGVDYDAIATVLTYKWGMENGFLDEIEIDLTTVGGIETFIEYKAGEIPVDEFRYELSTNGGRITAPTFDDETIANPMYTLRGFDQDTIMEEDSISDEAKQMIQDIIQRHYYCMRDEALSKATVTLYGTYYYNKIDKYKITMIQNNRLKSNLEKLEEKYKAILKLNRDQKKESNELKKTLKALETREKANRNRDNTKIGMDEHSKIVDKLNEDIGKLKGTCEEKGRENDKLCLEVSDLSLEVREIERSYTQLNEDYQNYKKESHKVNQDIPQESIVNSMKDKRITILGGDILHNKMNELGFNNLRLIKTDKSRVLATDLNNSEVMVVMTSYISHSFLEFPKQYAINNNIPLIYFNEKNLDLLCDRLFIHFNI